VLVSTTSPRWVRKALAGGDIAEQLRRVSTHRRHGNRRACTSLGQCEALRTSSPPLGPEQDIPLSSLCPPCTGHRLRIATMGVRTKGLTRVVKNTTEVAKAGSTSYVLARTTQITADGIAA
jgi:hypothetical protein